LGFDCNIIDEWSDCLIQGRPEVISMHGRTLSQMYRGQSDWEAIAQASARIRSHGILAFGNGDIKSLAEAHQRIQDTGVNGVLIGRGALGNPWIFQGIHRVRETLTTGSSVNLQTTEPSIDEKFQAMTAHAQCFEAIHGTERFVRMRKHLGWYCSTFPHAAAMRAQMVRTNGSQDVINILQAYLAEHTASETPTFASTPA
jgi:tRNA-dihydrouridine synthase